MSARRDPSSGGGLRAAWYASPLYRLALSGTAPEETAPMTGAAAAPAEEGVPVTEQQVELALDAEPPEQKKKRDATPSSGGLLRTASAAVARATGSAQRGGQFGYT